MCNRLAVSTLNVLALAFYGQRLMPPGMPPGYARTTRKAQIKSLLRNGFIGPDERLTPEGLRRLQNRY